MTRARIALLALVASVAAVALAGCGGGGNDNALGDDAVAVVDGTTITKAQLDELIDRSKRQAKLQKQTFPKVGTAEYKTVQSNLVTYLVRRTENEKEAAALGIAVTDAQVQSRLDQVKKQYYKNDDKKFMQAVKAQGLTLAQVQSDIRGQLLSQKLVDKLTQDVKVSDAEVQRYYDHNQSQYAIPESREVRHILVKTKAEAESIRSQLLKGADFAALAKKYSQDPGSKAQGGKLTISKGQTVPSFEEASFTLATMQLSQPVKTQFGYHLIQPLGAVKKGSTTPFKDVKAQIEAQLADTKKNEAVTKWSEKVDKKYEDKITYAEGYAPATTTATTG
jgi:parvulin-like peptidyl-prolyl isomerase